MAKQKKKRRPKTFVDRVLTWSRFAEAHNAAMALQDTDLMNAGLRAWQAFSNNRPRLASLVVSVALTLGRTYDLDCLYAGHSAGTSILDTDALHEHLERLQLENAVMQALLGSDIANEATGKLIAENHAWHAANLSGRFDLREKLLHAIHVLGIDNTTTVLGIILMLHSYDRHPQCPPTTLNDVLTTVRGHLDEHGKELV